MSEEQDQSQQPLPKQRPAKAVPEQALGPHASYWPIVLAVALFIALTGVITNPVVLGVGVVLTIAAVIGWGLERRY